MPTPYSAPFLNEALERSPYQHWLGVFVLRSRAGDLELLLPYRDEFHQGAAPVIHQGIIAALADITSRMAAIGIAGQDLSINRLRLEYLRDAAIGNELHAHGRASGGRIYVDIRTNDDRMLVARAIADVPALTQASVENSTVPQSAQPIYPI